MQFDKNPERYVLAATGLFLIVAPIYENTFNQSPFAGWACALVGTVVIAAAVRRQTKGIG